jgi:hypothetical protein
MITLGGTWYPDTARKWELSLLNHYEFNQQYDIGAPAATAENGQAFTMEASVGRTAGKYFGLGLIGNYSRHVTADVMNYGPNPFSPATSLRSLNTHPSIEVGTELRASVPQWDLVISVRYLRELGELGAPTYNLNVVGLTISKRF